MSSLRRGDDFPGLTFGVPPGASPSALLALGRQNADIIGTATYDAVRSGLKRLSLPSRALVLANQTSGPYAGRQPLYVASADEFFFDLDGTQILMAGADRASVGGVALFERCTGANGFSGSGSIDYIHPQSMSGVVLRAPRANRFVVTLDAAITWSDFVQCLVYDPVLDRYAARPCYAVPTTVSAAGIPITLATGSDQVTGHDYVVDCSTATTASFQPNLVTPGVELVFMHLSNANAISGVSTDKVVLPSGLRVHASANAVFYGIATSLDADCHCEAKLFTSVIPERGRFRRRMCASGGFLFTPSELSSTIGATIIGVGDDGIDVAAFTARIASSSGSKQVVVSGQSAAMPGAGQRVSLLDENRQERAVMTVRASTPVTGGASGDTLLDFTTSLPAGVTSTWAISPVTTSRGVLFKSGCRVQLTASAGLRISQHDVHVEDVMLGETMGPALEFADAGGTEYAPLKRFTADTLTVRNANCGTGFEPFAATVFLPRKVDESAYLQAGAFGEVQIGLLDVSGTSNGPAVAAGALDRFVLGSLTAEGLNAAPTSLGGEPVGCSIFLDNIAYAEIDTLSEREKPGRSVIACVGVGTLVMGEACGAIVPRQGVAKLVAYGKWLDFAPRFTPASGAFRSGNPPSTLKGCRWRMDRNRTWHMEGRIDMPADLGSARGPLLMTLPVTVASQGWEPGVIYDEAHTSGQWEISAEQNDASAAIQRLGHAGDLAAAASFYFSIGGEAAT